MLKNPHLSLIGKRIITVILNRYKRYSGKNWAEIRTDIDAYFAEVSGSNEPAKVTTRGFKEVYSGGPDDRYQSDFGLVNEYLLKNNISTDEEILYVVFGMVPHFFGGADPKIKDYLSDGDDTALSFSDRNYYFYQRGDIESRSKDFVAGTILLRTYPRRSFVGVSTERRHGGSATFKFEGVGFYDGNNYFHIMCRDQRLGRNAFAYCVFNNFVGNPFEPDEMTGIIIKKSKSTNLFLSPIVVTQNEVPSPDEKGFVLPSTVSRSLKQKLKPL